MRNSSYLQNSNKSILDRVGELFSTRRIRNLIKHEGKRNSLVKLQFLDYGSGYNAILSRNFWKLFGKVYLIDFDINKEVSLSADNLVILRGNPDKNLKSIPANSIDFILAHNVLEHVHNDLATLIELERVLAPGGLIYANVPSWSGKYFLEFAAFKLNLAPAEEMEDHKRYYNCGQLWLLLRATGFKPSLIKIKRTKFGLNTTGIAQKEQFHK
jgi:SAM-dependent methyltransferase